MGLEYKGNKWNEKDKKFLIENYGKLSNKEIAEKLDKTKSSVSNMAYALKLIDLYHFWSDEEIEILKKYYPLEGKKVANRLPYKTEKQCAFKAQALKIKFASRKYSKYKYVNWSSTWNKWFVSLIINGKRKNFGYFKDEDEAGRVAMEKAKEYGKAV